MRFKRGEGLDYMVENPKIILVDQDGDRWKWDGELMISVASRDWSTNACYECLEGVECFVLDPTTIELPSEVIRKLTNESEDTPTHTGKIVAAIREYHRFASIHFVKAEK